MKRIVALFKQAIQYFTIAKAPTHAAAIAFFTIFSLAPLVAIAVGIAGLFVGRAVAAGEITRLLQTVLGTDVAAYVSRIAEEVASQSTNATFTVLTIGAFIVGASAVFSQLKMALDDIWGTGSAIGSAGLLAGIVGTVRRRALAFLMILVGGVALILSVTLDVIFIQLGQFLEIWWPGISTLQPYLTLIVTPVVSFLVFTIMFLLLPETRPGWREVLVGATLTTVLFIVGTLIIGYYLGNSGTASLYGAAGSLIVILLWVYYSSWIVLFGASFTRAYGEYLSTTPSTDDAILNADRG